MAEERKAEKKRGPKGRVKHTPGRGHTRKSGPQKKKRYQKKSAQKRQTRQKDLRRLWDEWDSLQPEVQKLRPDLKPKAPRPNDEN